MRVAAAPASREAAMVVLEAASNEPIWRHSYHACSVQGCDKFAAILFWFISWKIVKLADYGAPQITDTCKIQGMRMVAGPNKGLVMALIEVLLLAPGVIR